MNIENSAPVIGPGDEAVSNPAASPWFGDIVERRYGRRDVVKGSLAAAVTTLIAGTALAHGDRGNGPGHHHDRDRDHGVKPGYGKRRKGPAFKAVPAFNPGREDEVVVPEGYSVQVLIPEGTPITGKYPEYIPGDFNTGAEREQQVGAHHDGMWYLPLSRGREGNENGLLCINFENIDQAFIHPQGFTRNADGSRPVEDEVRKEMASHGVGIVELKKSRHGEWRVARGPYNRRITAQTPMEISGPARGSDLLRTKYSPKGNRARGTLNNCANGYTPWDTYLTCEENWAGYFFNTVTANRPREHARYGIPTLAAGTYGWGTRAEDQYARFNATPTTDYYDAEGAKQDYRNEPNNFGWVVEIDPCDPKSVPKKRTALGRFGHEGAWVAPATYGKPIVVYMGDDSRGEYMYKFVSRKPWSPWLGRKAGDELLDEGTLYVARFNADGTGNWIALQFGKNGLTPANGFKNQADVLINTRSAADQVLATRMDRPEWADVDAHTGYVYLTLTNNTNRGVSADQPVEPANPRPRNEDGHIIRWRERGGKYWETEFEWDIFIFGGPSLATVQSLGPVAPYNADPQYAAQIFPGDPQSQAFLSDDASFNSPDGLWIDYLTGLVWIQTDGYSNTARGFGNQQMLAANPDTGEVKRFLVGPVGCELTGLTVTPDGHTMFANIQHPTGSWPNIDGETRPRSATLVITKDDGGIIGT